ncbi:tetratricopeptide repeat protein [Nodosilinea sp. LEGE 07088]|uniref:tetratricopeptide repeat protein n=1 Tax=Nodosilinea sp. LEGE 07088 TaxID=2777968 RepID=UPI00188189CE|nr:tetratricopeptide repeat protein [Nodosilinea sp. LEGE 07088]MBE9137205.1 tetratricopeptide repeat protein [Nodosilinea sp. LEGE 07088]
MAQPIDPNSPVSAPNFQSAPSVVDSYQRAVAAFKAKNYAQALALFQSLGQQQPDSPYSVKALMGQVRVYQQLGQVEQASQICQQLQKSPAAQVQQWAEQVMSQLTEKPTRAQPGPMQQAASTSTDLSGFVPLDRSLVSPQNLTASAPHPQAVPPTTDAQSQPASDGLAEQGAEQAGAAAHYQSLFHFQQLNERPAANPQVETPPAAVDPRATARPGTASRAKSRPSPPLPKHAWALWLGQGITAIALLWGINWLFHTALRAVDGFLRWPKWPVQLGIPYAPQTYTIGVAIGIVLLTLANPWILDRILALGYRQKSLSTRQLQAHSPRTVRLLRQVCRQQGWQLPELRLIPDTAPLCFSYGWLPRNTRIVVSQGLLDQQPDDVLTALYSYELARMVNHSLSILSAVGLPLLLLHSGYRWLATVGDGLTQPLARKSLGIFASALYGLFWLLRQMVLWLSRLCCSWGDRRAVALTQHPDHLAEGLLSLTRAIATYLQQQSALHPLHTSLEILMPISSRQAITPGSLLIAGHPLSASLLPAGGLSPYRQWLRVNASHEPLAERLLWLNSQALRQGRPGLTLDHQIFASTAQISLPLLLLQKAPLVGLSLGGSLAMGLWFIGGIVNRFGWQRLSWLYQDPSILLGGLWLGLGFGLLLRINTLFPDDVKSPQARHSLTTSPETVATLLQATAPVPIQGRPVTLKGKLLGQAGIHNWGCQDLYLNDASGLVKLVNPVPLGSLQGLLQARSHPLQWIGRSVTVIGWGRYGGGMLWVDINRIDLDHRHSFQAYGPIWATLLSLAVSLLGIVIIVRGG